MRWCWSRTARKRPPHSYPTSLWTPTLSPCRPMAPPPGNNNDRLPRPLLRVRRVYLEYRVQYSRAELHINRTEECCLPQQMTIDRRVVDPASCNLDRAIEPGDDAAAMYIYHVTIFITMPLIRTKTPLDGAVSIPVGREVLPCTPDKLPWTQTTHQVATNRKKLYSSADPPSLAIGGDNSFFFGDGMIE